MYVGPAPLKRHAQPVEGGFVERDGVRWYRIAHVDRMAPFFMSIVSEADHWLFISSTGALTAGRKDPDHALFPYETDDRIHDAQDRTGSKTLLLVEQGDRVYLWEPFSERYAGLYARRRHLYKSVYGNQIRFEEINDDLGLTLAYTWSPSTRFGFVKHVTLHHHGAEPVRVRVLDGLQQVLPYGATRAMQTERSNLLDAYKKNELDPATGLGLFTLSSIPVDRAEPSEALKATTVWAAGLDVTAVLLSSRQLAAFREGRAVQTEVDVRAQRGAYFVEATLALAPGEARSWIRVADVAQDAADVVALTTALAQQDALAAEVTADVEAGTDGLRRIVATADGLQYTADAPTTARHYANVLFNVMRGGVFADQYAIERADLVDFLRHANRPVAERGAAFLAALPPTLTLQDLRAAAAAQDDPQLERLCYEYLPLSFSRRHGDPSRPWNAFSIETHTEDGRLVRNYQGNWRDIFQNWEALGRAFPDYLEGMIARFVNASTPDGYNPYRITREGIDWEVIDPHDPWSYIGYWGDHQIIYLLKLLELSRAHHPGRLEHLLARRLFAYANVPYRIAPYADLLRDPHDTITYDDERAARIEARVAAMGADGKLVLDEHGEVYLVTLAEKLLVPVLAKLTNFIPDGGIWMNTQRPEWNDANNALVGYGVSMVTLYYLRRFLAFAADLFAALPDEAVALSEEVAELLAALEAAFERFEPRLARGFTDGDRRAMLDAVGAAGSTYRERIYAAGFSGRRRAVPPARIRAFLDRARAFLDASIRTNRRPDGLYHAYNLMAVAPDGGITLRHLYLMLEGQVAVLSAGVLTPAEALDLLAALRASDLYRPDQHSYLLYPDRRLPRFQEKNIIPPDRVEASALLRTLVADGNRHLVVRDVQGGYHFNGAFRNRRDVQAALDRLREQGYADLVDREGAAVVALFDDLFDHASYTGRSGTFFGYEGLGCIYWHMVSKLVLAVQEVCLDARRQGAAEETLQALIAVYYDLRAGIGLTKSPEVYGAFPIDPYSHTPAHAGAQQPGMTGQVKEDILARWGELGVWVEDGLLRFEPWMLRPTEWLAEPAAFACYDLDGTRRTLDLEAGSLAFTYGQVPVVYRRGGPPGITIHYRDGRTERIAGTTLPSTASVQVFSRTGAIRQLRVDVGADA
ncbi:MAG: hypothetical protein D6685_11185 [Bacteroidetes bacterium]|nr:MAG: hypothetical protein D6685_11185 [Bacteroidota bacterium]